MLNLSRQDKIIYIFLIIIALSVFSWIAFNQNKNDIQIISAVPNDEINDGLTEEDIFRKENEIQEDICIIHISGAVNKPGVYQLNSNARIIDAIKMAGGEKGNSNIHAINLAAHIYDGQKINVPYLIQKEGTGILSVKSNMVDMPSEHEEQSSSFSRNALNLNSASSSQLETLPGIGPVLAQRILEYRNSNGLFSKREDLMEVTGIGEKRFESIKEYITVY